MATAEMLKKLLDEFEEKEAHNREEINIIQEQISELERRIEQSKERLSSLEGDRAKVNVMIGRYADNTMLVGSGRAVRAENGAVQADSGRAISTGTGRPAGAASQTNSAGTTDSATSVNSASSTRAGRAGTTPTSRWMQQPKSSQAQPVQERSAQPQNRVGQTESQPSPPARTRRGRGAADQQGSLPGNQAGSPTSQQASQTGSAPGSLPAGPEPSFTSVKSSPSPRASSTRLKAMPGSEPRESQGAGAKNSPFLPTAESAPVKQNNPFSMPSKVSPEAPSGSSSPFSDPSTVAPASPNSPFTQVPGMPSGGGASSSPPSFADNIDWGAEGGSQDAHAQAGAGIDSPFTTTDYEFGLGKFDFGSTPEDDEFEAAIEEEMARQSREEAAEPEVSAHPDWNQNESAARARAQAEDRFGSPADQAGDSFADQVGHQYQTIRNQESYQEDSHGYGAAPPSGQPDPGASSQPAFYQEPIPGRTASFEDESAAYREPYATSDPGAGNHYREQSEAEDFAHQSNSQASDQTQGQALGQDPHQANAQSVEQTQDSASDTDFESEEEDDDDDEGDDTVKSINDALRGLFR